MESFNITWKLLNVNNVYSHCWVLGLFTLIPFTSLFSSKQENILRSPCFISSSSFFFLSHSHASFFLYGYMVQVSIILLNTFYPSQSSFHMACWQAVGRYGPRQWDRCLRWWRHHRQGDHSPGGRRLHQTVNGPRDWVQQGTDLFRIKRSEEDCAIEELTIQNSVISTRSKVRTGNYEWLAIIAQRCQMPQLAEHFFLGLPNRKRATESERPETHLDVYHRYARPPAPPLSGLGWYW